MRSIVENYPERNSSPRLPGYDYSLAGYYFITACTAGRRLRFGVVENGGSVINKVGEIVQATWIDLPKHYAGLLLDEFVIMPNHVHGILILPQSEHGLSEIVRGLKTWSARRINKLEGTKGEPVWQRSFYDHIIRDEQGLQNIRSYIHENPLNWETDSNNPTVTHS